MQVHHNDLPEAEPGLCIALNLKDISVNDIRRGMVAGISTDNPPVAVKSFVAMIGIYDYPGKKRKSDSYRLHTFGKLPRCAFCMQT